MIIDGEEEPPDYVIDSVFVTKNLLSVTKKHDVTWKELEPKIRYAIEDYYAQKNPVFEYPEEIIYDAGMYVVWWVNMIVW